MDCMFNLIMFLAGLFALCYLAIMIALAFSLLFDGACYAIKRAKEMLKL
jgi:hypothetical protein